MDWARLRVFVAGHRGLVGSALVRALQVRGCDAPLTRTRAELDLRDEAAVASFFVRERPEVVFLAAATVGGIHANQTWPAAFIRDNLAIQTAVLHQAHLAGVRKLVFFGSSCMYPRECPQPMKESSLLTGPFEPTNEAYAAAKVAGWQMARAYRRQHGADFITLIPANLYGPNDNFNPLHSHVVPALMRRFHEAGQRGDQEVVIWGTGRARRDFMHVDDLAAAAIFLAEHYASDEPINIGAPASSSIAELAEAMRAATGFSGRLRFDTDKPDGMPLKGIDASRLVAMGWSPRIGLAEGLRSTYEWFRAAAQPRI